MRACRRRPRVTGCSSSRTSDATARGPSPPTAPSGTRSQCGGARSPRAPSPTSAARSPATSRSSSQPRSLSATASSAASVARSGRASAAARPRSTPTSSPGVDRRDETITSLTTNVDRTKQSAEALAEGLAQGGLDLKTELKPSTEADDLLRFGNRVSPAGRQITEEILDRTAIRDYADDLLRSLYSSEFVDTLKDPVGAALDVYKLYSTAPGMAKETDITFARYVPEATREPLSYATDVETFYQYGPGVEGETNTYEKARPLLDDFFARLDQRIAGSSTAVVYRLAHGETTMPFAALIKAPGSEKQVPDGDRFTRGTNPWRGAVAGGLAGNIEWSAFRNDAGRVLVTMRQNEKPVPFHDGCAPESDGGYFYTVDELKRCLR